jgi:GST-like protein
VRRWCWAALRCSAPCTGGKTSVWSSTLTSWPAACRPIAAGAHSRLGQAHHFRLYAPEKIAYAIDRYTNEAKRIYGVIDKQLAKNKFIAGKTYSIADIAIFPWLRSWENQGITLTDFPHLRAWFDGIAARPAVQRGVKVLADLRQPITGDKEREVLFGKTQYEKR